MTYSELTKKLQELEDSFAVRYMFTKYIWIKPTKFNIEQIVKAIGNEKVLEICSGEGILAKELKDTYNVDIITTDICEDSRYGFNYSNDIEKIDAVSAVKKYQDINTILAVWVPYDDSFMVDVLKAMKPDQRLIFVGENYGGCNATDEFFETIMDEKSFKVEEINEFDRWFGINDYIQIITKLK